MILHSVCVMVLIGDLMQTTAPRALFMRLPAVVEWLVSRPLSLSATALLTGRLYIAGRMAVYCHQSGPIMCSAVPLDSAVSTIHVL